MATITLKGVSERLHSRLKRRARKSGRSLNREIISSLEQMVREEEEEPDLEEWLARVRAHREHVGLRLTARQIRRYKESGRK